MKKSQPKEISVPQASQLECAICHHVSHGYHFGILACRACAAFFRRTVAEKKVYACRGDFNCEIKKDLRNMCRACRFKKCERIGMNKSDVQMNRDPIGKKNESVPMKTIKIEPGLSINESDCILDSQKLKTEYNKPVELPQHLIFGQFTVLERLTAGCSSYHNSQKSLVSDEILSRKEFNFINDTTCREMDFKCIPLLYNMVIEYFQPFDKLDKMTRIHTIQNYAVCHQILTSIFLTVNHNGPLPNGSWMLFYGQYAEGKNIKAFIGDSKTKDQSRSLLLQFIHRMSKLKDFYIRLNIDQVIHCAIIGILFWQEISMLMPLWTEAIKMREEIFKELHDYVLRYYGQKTVGRRLGAVTWIIEEVNSLSKIMMEKLTIEKIFNAPSNADVLDVLKNIKD